MNLGELITTLEAADPAQTVRHGFANPHSYRGDYMDLAFEPADDTTVRAMLDAARSAVYATFQGWKGGEFVMSMDSWCWLSPHGEASCETLSPQTVAWMLAASAWPAPATDRTEVRDRIAALADDLRYMLDHRGPGHAHDRPGVWDTSGKPCTHCARLAVAQRNLAAYDADPAAVLPAPVDPAVVRATALREGAAALGRMDYDTDSNDYGYDTYRDAWNGGVMDGAGLLGRMADETPRPAVALATPCTRCPHPYNWHASRGACEFGNEINRCGCTEFAPGARPEPVDPRRILGVDTPPAAVAQPAPMRRSEDVCPGFPDRCPNLRPVDPDPPIHLGGIRCGCADKEA